MSVFSISTITHRVRNRFSPNKTQNTLCRFALMPIIGFSSILNIKVKIRGQRSPNCDFNFFFYISIARILILYSYVALTTKIDISWSFCRQGQISRSIVKRCPENDKSLGSVTPTIFIVESPNKN